MRANEIIEIQHALFGITLRGKLYLAPIGENPPNVLDIGTGSAQPSSLNLLHFAYHTVLGTGVWAIEFGVHLSTLSKRI
jgi:hypothetical protein